VLRSFDGTLGHLGKGITDEQKKLWWWLQLLARDRL